jgi:predicted MFS family arabinose efflux permease
MALSMDITNPKVGATQFSILMGMGNLGIILAGAASGSLYVMLGFNRMFLYAALIFGPSLLLLYFIRFKKIKPN